jgi:hypothetical protein
MNLQNTLSALINSDNFTLKISELYFYEFLYLTPLPPYTSCVVLRHIYLTKKKSENTDLEYMVSYQQICIRKK